MTAKSDSLTRLVERTTGHADVVRPMVRPMFSPAAMGEGPFIQPADLTMAGETFVESVVTPDTPVNSPPFTHVQQPDAPGTPLIGPPPVSPGWKRDTDTGPVLQKKAVTGQEHMGNTPGHKASPESRPLLPSVSTTQPAGYHVSSGPVAGSIKGDSKPVGHVDVEVNIVNRLSPLPRPQSPLLSVDAANAANAANAADTAESFSLEPGPQPGDQTLSMKEPLKSRRRFQTGLDKGKESKRGGEPAAPVVRVTIGRIDVRAVLQQPPVQPAAAVPEPVKPTLSLDEYLRQRDGGKR
jgi:hypothetical protein